MYWLILCVIIQKLQLKLLNQIFYVIEKFCDFFLFQHRLTLLQPWRIFSWTRLYNYSMIFIWILFSCEYFINEIISQLPWYEFYSFLSTLQEGLALQQPRRPLLLLLVPPCSQLIRIMFTVKSIQIHKVKGWFHSNTILRWEPVRSMIKLCAG